MNRDTYYSSKRMLCQLLHKLEEIASQGKMDTGRREEFRLIQGEYLQTLGNLDALPFSGKYYQAFKKQVDRYEKVLSNYILYQTRK